MLKYMLDTDICIYAIKNRPAEIRAAFELHDGHMCVSTVTAMELVWGAEKSSRVEANLQAVEGLLARLEVLDFDKSAAWQAAQVRAELERAGLPIGPYDLMIAGHARSMGLTVVTHNLREFSRVAGLRCESWVQSKPVS